MSGDTERLLAVERRLATLARESDRQLAGAQARTRELAGTVRGLSDDVARLGGEHEQLEREHHQLQREHQQLERDHEQLGRDHERLQREHEQLGRDHERLLGEQELTGRERQEQRGRHEALEREHEVLERKYEELLGEREDLSDRLRVQRDQTARRLETLDEQLDQQERAHREDREYVIKLAGRIAASGTWRWGHRLASVKWRMMFRSHRNTDAVTQILTRMQTAALPPGESEPSADPADAAGPVDPADGADA